MEIITPTGKYKWIGKYWGTTYVWDCDLDLTITSDVQIIHWLKDVFIIWTHHTPEQLVKLGYLELITKPEEKPKYDNTSFAWKVPAEEYDRIMDEVHGFSEPDKIVTDENWVKYKLVFLW